MNSAGFDSARWDHWLMIVSFLAIATTGLWITWQWRQAARQAQQKTRAKAKMARRLAVEIHPIYTQQANHRSASTEPRVIEASGRFGTKRKQR